MSSNFWAYKTMFASSFDSVSHRVLKKRSIFIVQCLRNFQRLIVNLQRDLRTHCAKAHLRGKICGCFQYSLRCLCLVTAAFVLGDDQEPDSMNQRFRATHKKESRLHWHSSAESAVWDTMRMDQILDQLLNAAVLEYVQNYKEGKCKQKQAPELCRSLFPGCAYFLWTSLLWQYFSVSVTCRLSHFHIKHFKLWWECEN